MDDEATDIGTTDWGVGRPRLESSIDKAGRDLEFSLFYRQDMPRLVGFLTVQGARPHIAADVAQDAMMNCYRRWDTIEAPRAWVRTVASRAWWRQVERDRAEASHGEPDEFVGLLSLAESAEIESRHAFVAMVSHLSLGQRQVMAWTYDGYLPTEIAALLGKQPATVRSTLRAARAVLRKLYGCGEESP